MARWSINRRADGHLELEYRRPGTLGVFKAGDLNASTTTVDIIAWIVSQDATASGDVVTLADGAALLILASGRA